MPGLIAQLTPGCWEEEEEDEEGAGGEGCRPALADVLSSSLQMTDWRLGRSGQVES